jgi:asparagine synthase (glutamine-hydrolysing)
MCGITGWVDHERDLSADPSIIAAMTATLTPRGPDDVGTYVSRAVALGHRRLAVLDPAHGAQPMVRATATGEVVLVFGGEVYNFTELRRRLIGRGHRFVTGTDTEVVLAAYLEWGLRAPERLEGMFAFAVWDGRTHRLHLVRDRLGVKPLLLLRTPAGVVFASEAKAVLANPLARAVVDRDGVRRMLAHVLALPGTPWARIEEVEPGTVVTVSPEGLTRPAYWRLGPAADAGDGPEADVDAVREHLREEVRRQLVADVPVGVLLSGGLDSSILAALAGRHPRTFSVGLGGEEEPFTAGFERAADDRPFVRLMAEAIDSRHQTVVLDAPAVNAPSARRAAVAAYDQPPGFGDRDRSMLQFFTQVKEHVTVALSGEGADEVFGGYSWFHRPFAGPGPDLFAWVSACRDTYAVLPQALRPELAADLDLDAYLRDRYADAVAAVPAATGGETSAERRTRISRYLHLSHHLRVLLERKDRLSMAAGLEVRVPYTDHRLVEFALAVPWARHCADGREKSLLRAAFADRLPAAITGRVKSAYPVLRGPADFDGVRAEAAVLLEEPGHAVFDLVDERWLRPRVLPSGSGVTPLTARERHTVEWVLNTAVWLEQRKPELRL